MICDQSEAFRLFWSSYNNNESLHTLVPCLDCTESKKDGEPRNQVPEEGFKSEEGWLEILHILLSLFRI